MPNISRNTVSLDSVKPALIQITDRLFKKIGVVWVSPQKNPLQGNNDQ